MRAPPEPSLPELHPVACPACGGDGYTLVAGSGEDEVGCAACGGFGVVEVCSGCGAVPALEGGYEVCRCTEAALPERRAA
ncbi:hypothetical protein [Truepera radiovictrix]|uniref:Uncharacterized protein n=1 Tax=Truepera radiovictrix (strain DSM 17093 / CIP 108686 / LMG 22925 / RQ-24) TaxID=649638 RepID=D7CRI3_TRURR|nr:hypothetical protein [Truepera radiovictrix]ADI13473.1 hypothetical protein Trad_0334 [Truepera radiovictrix DSM 17093]WMT57965.1 hypothetical protein RCV51_03200 [Truepera radiovictrix]